MTIEIKQKSKNYEDSIFFVLVLFIPILILGVLYIKENISTDHNSNFVIAIIELFKMFIPLFIIFKYNFFNFENIIKNKLNGGFGATDILFEFNKNGHGKLVDWAIYKTFQKNSRLKIIGYLTKELYYNYIHPRKFHSDLGRYIDCLPRSEDKMIISIINDLYDCLKDYSEIEKYEFWGEFGIN